MSISRAILLTIAAHVLLATGSYCQTLWGSLDRRANTSKRRSGTGLAVNPDVREGRENAAAALDNLRNNCAVPYLFAFDSRVVPRSRDRHAAGDEECPAGSGSE